MIILEARRRKFCVLRAAPYVARLDVSNGVGTHLARGWVGLLVGLGRPPATLFANLVLCGKLPLATCFSFPSLSVR